MICKNCNNSIPDTAKFCPKCGAKVEITERPVEVQKPTDVLLCPKCGTSYPLTAKFCKNDGTPLQRVSPPMTEIKKPEVTEKEIKPEAAAEPKLEVKTEEKPSEAVIEPKVSIEEKPLIPGPEKPEDVIICPKCGTENHPTARFCRKDGTPLKEETKPPVAAEKEIKPEVTVRHEAEITPAKVEIKKEQKRPSKTWVWVAACILFLIIAGVGSYLYFSGQIGKKTGEVTAVPEVTTKPQEPIKAPEVVEKPASPQEPETVQPPVPTPETPKPAKAPIPAPASISKIDPAKLEGDINRALRNAGLRGVTSEVNDNLEVTLKGSVGSNNEKNRAFEIAKSFKEAKKIRDVIFVVEQ